MKINRESRNGKQSTMLISVMKQGSVWEGKLVHGGTKGVFIRGQDSQLTELHSGNIFKENELLYEPVPYPCATVYLNG